MNLMEDLSNKNKNIGNQKKKIILKLDRININKVYLLLINFIKLFL